MRGTTELSSAWRILRVPAVVAATLLVRSLIVFLIGDGRVVEVRVEGEQDAGCVVSFSRDRGWLSNAQRVLVECNSLQVREDLRVRCRCGGEAVVDGGRAR